MWSASNSPPLTYHQAPLLQLVSEEYGVTDSTEEGSEEQPVSAYGGHFGLVVIVGGMVIGTMGSFGGLWWAICRFQRFLAPDDAFLFTQTEGGFFAMGLPLCLPAISLGLLFSQLCIWSIPPLRRNFEATALARNEANFRESTMLFLRISAGLLVLVLPFCIIGAFSFYFYVTDDGVQIGPTFYDWSEVEAVNITCCRVKKTRSDAPKRYLDIQYVLRMRDGTSADLMLQSGPNSTLWGEEFPGLVAGIERIQPYLAEQHAIRYERAVSTKGIERLRRWYPGEPAADSLARLLEE